MDKTKQFWLEDQFRPTFEFNASVVWFYCGLFTLFIGGLTLDSIPSSMFLIIAGSMLFISALRFYQGIPLLRRQLKMFTNYFYKLDMRDFRNKNLKDKSIINLGLGFEWGVEHAQRAMRITSMSSDFSEVKLPMLAKPFLMRNKTDTLKLGGKAWIQGLGDEKPIEIQESVAHGHTSIFGVPGSGKTTLLTLLAVSSLHRGNSNIIIDPKNDPNWRKALESEAKALGKPFYFFHPAHSSTSCRIDPLKNYSRSVELASRISNLLPGSEQEQDPFSQFAWKCINQIVCGQLYIDERPQISSIGFYLQSGKRKLAEKCLDKLFKEVIDPNWRHLRGNEMMKEGGGVLLDGMIMHYQSVLQDVHGDDAIDGIISLVTHDAQHMSRMLASTDPLFAQLNSSPLKELLSPELDLGDDDIKRPIVDLEKFVETGGVLYVALDSMSDSVTSAALAKLILGSLCATSAKRYNYSEGRGRRLSIFCDESHSAISNSLIDLLAASRGSSFELYVSTQSIPDYIAKSSDAVANRLLGLTSNFICLRCTDTVTQEYASSNFGETFLKSVSHQLGGGGNTSGDLSEQSGSFGEKLSDVKECIFNPFLLGELPNLQYIARLQNGKKIKGRIPFLTGVK